MEFTILFIIILLITLVTKNCYKENFSIQNVNPEFKNNFINDLKQTIEGTVLYEDNINIKKFNNSSKLIVSNISVANPLQDSFYSQNIKYIDNHLKYNLQALEHKTNIYSGYYITKPIQTVKKNKNYGFIFEYNPEKPYNNEAEISIDFTKQKKSALDNIQNINKIKESVKYKNLPKKTVNVYSPLTTPLDIMPYFNKGDNDKEIKLLVLFYDQMNYDFLKSLPDGRFNILDNKLNPVLVNCKIDTPFCNISLRKTGKILGREKYIVGKFNPIVNKYTVFDTDEFNELKNRTNEESQTLRRNFNQNRINEAKGDGKLVNLSPKQRNFLRINDPKSLNNMINRRVTTLSSKNYDELSETDKELLREHNLGVLTQIVNQKVSTLRYKTLRQMSESDRQFLQKYNKISDYQEHSHGSSKHRHIVPNPLLENEILINDNNGKPPFQDYELKNNFNTSKNYIFNIEFQLGEIPQEQRFFYIFSIKKNNTRYGELGNRYLLIFTTHYNNNLYIYVTVKYKRERPYNIEYTFPYQGNENAFIKINIKHIFNGEKYELHSELKKNNNIVNTEVELPILIDREDVFVDNNCQIFLGTDNKTLENINRPDDYQSAYSFLITQANYIRLPDDININNHELLLNHTKEISIQSENNYETNYPP